MGHGRRRSVSSSSSSSNSSSSSSGDDHDGERWKKSHKKDKHKKDKYKKDKHQTPTGDAPAFPNADLHNMGMPPMPVMPRPDAPSALVPPLDGSQSRNLAHPPPRASVPEAGHRLPYAAERSNEGFKREYDAGGFRTTVDLATAGTPPTIDKQLPVFVGSAIVGNGRSVHPCKIVPAFDLPARYSYAGIEVMHEGRFDLLPVDLEVMEWVPASHGQLPQGRRLVQGGYEEGGERLYHAIAIVEGVRVPGKTGTHLYGANIPYGGREHIAEQYEVLCWRD